MFGLDSFFGGKKFRVKDKVRGMEQEWKQQSVATLWELHSFCAYILEPLF